MEESTFTGAVELSHLPVHRGLSLDIAFFAVPRADAPVPYDADPPGDAVTDCHKIYANVDLHAESLDTPANIPFSIPHPSGFFYIQVRAVLYRFHNGKHFAQAEQFFFARCPLPLTPDLPPVALPVEWPDIPIEELGYYGTVKPKRKWPWPLTLFVR